MAQSDGSLPSKNTIRRAINKVKSEFDIIEKIIGTLKEFQVVREYQEGNTGIDTIIETLDKELEEIGVQVYLSIESADGHLKQRA